MKFLESILNALVNRSPEELFGGLLIAAAVAVVMACLFTLARRNALPSATFVGGLVLAGGVLCMTLAAGYIEHTGPTLNTPSSVTTWAEFPPWPRSSQGSNAQSGPRGNFMPDWSSGFHFVLAADEDRDGHVTAEELARLVRKADSDGDGSVDFHDIDRIIASRSLPPGNPPGSFTARRISRTGRPSPQDGQVEPRPSSPRHEDDAQPSPSTETSPKLDE